MPLQSKMNEHPDTMKTFILMWNPTISNYKKEDFEQITPCEYCLSWSVWDYKQVECDDLFYMVKVGEGNTGIVLAGNILAKAQEGDDWSGRGRKVFYADFNVEFASAFDTPFISTEQLMKEIPGFDWTGGHSGRVLPDDMAEKLESLFDTCLSRKRPTLEYSSLSLKEKEEYWLKALERKANDKVMTSEQWHYEWHWRVLYEDENIYLAKTYLDEFELTSKKNGYSLETSIDAIIELADFGKDLGLEGYEGKTLVDYMRDREFPLTFISWI